MSLASHVKISHADYVSDGPILLGPPNTGASLLLGLTAVKRSVPLIKRMCYWRASEKARVFLHAPEQHNDATDVGKVAREVEEVW